MATQKCTLTGTPEELLAFAQAAFKCPLGTTSASNYTTLEGIAKAIQRLAQQISDQVQLPQPEPEPEE